MSRVNVSENLAQALIEQWAHETYNSHIYLHVGAFFKNRGFDNIAETFVSQADEELEHAKLIFNLISDVDVVFHAPAIPRVEYVFETILDVAELFLSREILTTDSLNEIYKLSDDEQCPVVREFIGDMISKQQAEYAESTKFMDNAEVLGGDWKAVLLWDASMGK